MVFKSVWSVGTTAHAFVGAVAFEGKTTEKAAENTALFAGKTRRFEQRVRRSKSVEENVPGLPQLPGACFWKTS